MQFSSILPVIRISHNIKPGQLDMKIYWTEFPQQNLYVEVPNLHWDLGEKTIKSIIKWGHQMGI